MLTPLVARSEDAAQLMRSSFFIIDIPSVKIIDLVLLKVVKQGFYPADYRELTPERGVKG
jgi:hypothetical protein